MKCLFGFIGAVVLASAALGIHYGLAGVAKEESEPLGSGENLLILIGSDSQPEVLYDPDQKAGLYVMGLVPGASYSVTVAGNVTYSDQTTQQGDLIILFDIPRTDVLPLTLQSQDGSWAVVVVEGVR